MRNTTAYALIDGCVLGGDFDHFTDQFKTKLGVYKIDEYSLRFSLSEFTTEQVAASLEKFKQINKKQSSIWKDTKDQLVAIQKSMDLTSKVMLDMSELIKIYKRHKPAENINTLF